MQIYEKYQQLARDAASSGERIASENLLQHAEHYYRLMAAAGMVRNPERDDLNPDDLRTDDQRADDERADDERADNQRTDNRRSDNRRSDNQHADTPEPGAQNEASQQTTAPRNAAGEDKNPRRRPKPANNHVANSGNSAGNDDGLIAMLGRGAGDANANGAAQPVADDAEAPEAPVRKRRPTRRRAAGNGVSAASKGDEAEDSAESGETGPTSD